MKKLIIMLGIIIAMVMFGGAAAFAEDANVKDDGRGDSVKISDELRQKLNVRESDEVYRLYCLDIIFSFDYCNNIDEAFENGEVFSECYLVKNEKGEICYKEFRYKSANAAADNRDKELIELGETEQWNINEKVQTVFLNDKDSVIRKVSPDIEVYETYYLHGANYSGSGIYYKTNKGDYVYYVDGGEYLLPIEELCKISKAVCDKYRSLPEYSVDGAISVHDVCDMSRYDINSPKFFLNSKLSSIILWVSIAAGVILLAAAVIIVGIRVRKKRK